MWLRLSRLPVVLLVALSFWLSPRRVGADEPLLGTKPPQWQVIDWMHSKPLTLQELAGKVLLVRWWTAPGCPYCAATAPALNAFHTQYKDQGLVIVGLYHHKAATPLKVAD